MVVIRSDVVIGWLAHGCLLRLLQLLRCLRGGRS